MIVFANIGSNLGDSRLTLARAVRAIANEFGNFEISHAVESEPWGFGSTRNFTNIGISFHTDMAPEEILDRLQAIEAALNRNPHRNPDGSYADREADIDIVAIDRLQIDTPRLKVPHPHLASRRFFLQPLEELAPGWTHPATMLTPSEMLLRLDAAEDTHPGKTGGR